MKLVCKFALCISALIFIFAFSGCGPVEYSVKDFAVVTVSGYADHGKLTIKVNDTTISKLYADNSDKKADAMRFSETFKFTFEGQNEEDSYFSNGDVVTINVTYDEEMAADLGVKMIDSSFDYTINGLEDKVEVSPFEGLSVNFSGVAPYGTVQLDKSNCIQYVIDNVTFYCDNYDLSNGDKVVVRAEYTAEAAERNGYIFTEDVKKYTVVGLPKYVTTMAGVSYASTTALMHRMVEKYIAETDSAYKSLDWCFGEEDSDTDEEISNENEDESENNEEVSDGESERDFDDEYLNTSSEEEDPLSDVEKIKSDFMVADFDASFVYEPLACYYSIDSVQYSDNIFSAAYRVVGTFVCTESNGSGYIKPGDTVVGEIFVISSLAGGSVDIKNTLVYDESTLNNYFSYSCRSFSTSEELEDDIFGTVSYMTEILDYLEDQETYDNFKDPLNNPTSSRTEPSHITVDSDSDSDTDNESSSKRSSSDEADSEFSQDGYSEYENESEVLYYDPDFDRDYNYGYDYDQSYGDYYYDDQDEYYYGY